VLLTIAVLALPVSAAPPGAVGINRQAIVNVTLTATLLPEVTVLPTQQEVRTVETLVITPSVTTVPTTAPAAGTMGGAAAPLNPSVVAVMTPTSAPTPAAAGLAGNGSGIATSAISGQVNNAGIAGEVKQNAGRITTPVGQEIPGTDHSVPLPGQSTGSGLPGGIDVGKALPSGEDRATGLGSGVLGGGTDYLGQGTPFDTNPLSNPMDSFMNQYGANLDPLAAEGLGRTGFSPADSGDSSQSGASTQDKTVAPANDDSSQSGGSTQDKTVALANDDGSTVMLCAGDYVGVDNSKKDECVVIEFSSSGGFKSSEDAKMANEWLQNWVDFNAKNPVPAGTHDQQYEGEGGYVGGGSSANDIMVGAGGKSLGKGPSTGQETPGLGKDTGGNIPALYQSIASYVAKGGKLHGVKGGFDPGSSGLGGDIGGASENSVNSLKKALNTQRFIIDPDTMTGDEVPWWMQRVVSPTTQAATTAT
jgi:hypothetical protein